MVYMILLYHGLRTIYPTESNMQHIVALYLKHIKINCGVPQGSILGPILLLLYINDLSTVSEACMSILFADATNMFLTGKNLQTMSTVINEEQIKVQEWLYCNKLSLHVLKTHYMIFTSRNKCMNDVDIRINNVKIERVYATKFLGVQIDAQLTWK